jgi:hypothetical protein
MHIRTTTDSGTLMRRNRRKQTNTVRVRNFMKTLVQPTVKTMADYRKAAQVMVLT